MTTANDTGHKVADGRKTDYFGAAAEEPAADENHPWDWIDEYAFWVSCALAGISFGFGWGIGGLIQRFLINH